MKVVLPSNKGHSTVLIEFRAPMVLAGEPGFDVAVSIQTVHWSSSQPRPCNLTIEGLGLREAALVALLSAVSKWLELPLSEQAAEELVNEFELGIHDQSIVVRFGPRDDLIAERHPVVTFEIKASALHVSVHFAADQSCLVLFANGLAEAIKQET